MRLVQHFERLTKVREGVGLNLSRTNSWGFRMTTKVTSASQRRHPFHLETHSLSKKKKKKKKVEDVVTLAVFPEMAPQRFLFILITLIQFMQLFRPVEIHCHKIFR